MIVLPLASRRLELTHTLVMGVLNVTPDSFSDGGRFLDPSAAVDAARSMLACGVDVLDVGGESTRPGAAPVTVDEEAARVVPVIRALRQLTPRPVVSIDTFHARTAEAALEAGAEIVNDVTGGRAEPEILALAARAGAVMVLGHLRGTPRTMQENVHFADVVAEVSAELAECVRSAQASGIDRARIWVDPGLGFGKTFEHNLLLLRSIRTLSAACGVPVLVGPSRKAFLGAITGKPAPERDAATHAAVAAAILHGADGVRVHDARGGVDASRVADAIRRGQVKD
jgi:dihydropteroate synthase